MDHKLVALPIKTIRDVVNQIIPVVEISSHRLGRHHLSHGAMIRSVPRFMGPGMTAATCVGRHVFVLSIDAGNCFVQIDIA